MNDLKMVLTQHAKWLLSVSVSDSGGKRADLREADLREADLRGANLRRADLRRTDLREADLWRADLRRADLRGADLREANLWGADLRRTDLQEADLRGADLWGADLWEANLRRANLNWQSHDLLAEILRQVAKNDTGKRSLAGLVLVSRDWCWSRFISCGHADLEWGLDVLRKYVKDGDGSPKAVH